MEMIFSIPLMVVGMSAVFFYATVGILTLFLLIALAGDRESWGWGSLWLIIGIILLLIRFKPEPILILGGFIGWVICGLIYTYFWRWPRQLNKLRERVMEANENRTDRGDARYVEVSSRGIDLSFMSSVMVTSNDKIADVLPKFRPKFIENKGRLTVWVTLWGIYVMKDLTVDLIRNALDFFRASFEAQANKAFKV